MQSQADERVRVLAVSGNPQNLVLLTRVLETAGYDVFTAACLDAFDKAIGDEVKPNLALVDITGFDQRIWSRCEKLREEDVLFLLVGARHRMALDQAGDRVGAASVLVKPLAVRELVNLIGLLLQPA